MFKYLSQICLVMVITGISLTSAYADTMGAQEQRVGNWTFRYLKNPSKSTKIGFFPIVKWRGKGIAVLYWKVGDSKSETALKAFQQLAKLSRFAHKLRFVTAVKITVASDEEKAAVRAKKLSLTLPLLLDKSQLGPYMGAFYQFPKYGLIDRKGFIKIHNCSSLTETAGPRTTFLKSLQLSATEKPIPHYRCMGKAENTHKLVGQKLPDVGLNDENGKNKTVSTFLRKRPIIVVFWSVTCDHCRKLLPVLAKYWNTRQGNLDMLSITRAPSKELKDMVKKLFTEQNVQWPVGYAPENATLSFYKIVKVPTVILADKNGKIVHTWIQPDDKWIAGAIEAALIHYKLF